MNYEAANEKICRELIQHLKLGKPLGNRKRKPIGEKTARKYAKWGRDFSAWFAKPLNQLTASDVDAFRLALKDDKVRADDGKPYECKRDIEVKGLKTLLQFVGKPELALFSTDYTEQKEIPALSREEIESMVVRAKLRDKAILQLLFDSGARADEFLSLRFCDVYDDSLKSGGYYKLRIIKSKTLPRTVGLTLPLSTEILKEWLKANKEKNGTTASLIDLSYRHFNLIVSRFGAEVLKKKITPHTLRHSSATYYCHYLSRYQLCKRYGWSMSSAMPALYIDREGVEDDSINQKVVAEENTTLQKQINALQEQLSSKNEQVASMQSEMDNRMKEMQVQVMRLVADNVKKRLSSREA